MVTYGLKRCSAVVAILALATLLAAGAARGNIRVIWGLLARRHVGSDGVVRRVLVASESCGVARGGCGCGCGVVVWMR